jgi:hydroxymethylglutaryl-CoA lyase
MIKILETPRDAMQGIVNFIPTPDKVKYLNTLLKAGFDSLDFGSFVSPKAIPQLRDSSEVIELLEVDNKTEIVATIGNFKGAERALMHNKIDTVAYPFSISETFLQKNINSNFDRGKKTIDDILNLCSQKNKSLKLYIAMAFGNPYGDKWNIDILTKWIYTLSDMGVTDIVLADTTGDGSVEHIGDSYSLLNKEFPNYDFGAHLHTLSSTWKAKVSAAYNNGCRSFDTVIGGLGGCPMSGKALMGNLNTFDLINFMEERGEEIHINKNILDKARIEASFLFN